MSEIEMGPDSARAKKSRKKRMDQGYTRFDCLVSPQATKYAKRIMRVRKFGNKTEMLEMLLVEENLRIRQGKTDGEVEGQ